MTLKMKLTIFMEIKIIIPKNFRNLKLYKEIESFYLLINDQVKVQNIDFDKKNYFYLTNWY